MTESTKIELGEPSGRDENTRSISAAAITGAGDRHFCGGADTSRLARQAQDGFSSTASTPFAPKLSGVSKPIIAALNGATIGASIGLAADADIVVASQNAYLMDPHLDLGI